MAAAPATRGVAKLVPLQHMELRKQRGRGWVTREGTLGLQNQVHLLDWGAELAGGARWHVSGTAALGWTRCHPWNQKRLAATSSRRAVAHSRCRVVLYAAVCGRPDIPARRAQLHDCRPGIGGRHGQGRALGVTAGTA